MIIIGPLGLFLVLLLFVPAFRMLVGLALIVLIVLFLVGVASKPSPSTASFHAGAAPELPVSLLPQLPMPEDHTP